MNRLFVILLLAASAASLASEYELQMVQVVTRHGARTPYSILPTGDNVTWDCQMNPISTVDFNDAETAYVHGRLYRQQYISGRELLAGNCSEGQLTSVGAKQQIALGEWFREWLVYNTSLLSEEYKSDEIYIRAADVPRCIESAQSLLLGLYPPKHHSERIEVININTIEQSADNLEPSNCPRLQQICTQIETTSTWQQEIASFQAVQQYLLDLWGITAAQFPAWPGIYDVLESREANGYGLPLGISPEIAQQVENISSWQLGYLYEYSGVAPLAIGTFVTDLLTAIDNFINRYASYRFYLYSGHDTTLAPLLAAFGVYDGTWPVYASHLEIKLYTDSSDNYYVGWSYNGAELTLPGCNGLCTLEEFQQLAAKVALSRSSFADACQPVAGEPGCAPGDYYCMYLC